MFFLLHPLADMVVPTNDFEFIDQALARTGRPATTRRSTSRTSSMHGDAGPPRPRRSATTARRWTATLQDPALGAAQDATLRRSRPSRLLYLHGADDGCMSAPDSAETADCLYRRGQPRRMVADAGHFLQLEQPEVVNR